MKYKSTFQKNNVEYEFYKFRWHSCIFCAVSLYKIRSIVFLRNYCLNYFLSFCHPVTDWRICGNKA